jgi:hypothetical protein
MVAQRSRGGGRETQYSTVYARTTQAPDLSRTPSWGCALRSVSTSADLSVSPPRPRDAARARETPVYCWGRDWSSRLERVRSSFAWSFDSIRTGHDQERTTNSPKVCEFENLTSLVSPPQDSTPVGSQHLIRVSILSGTKFVPSPSSHCHTPALPRSSWIRRFGCSRARWRAALRAESGTCP